MTTSKEAAIDKIGLTERIKTMTIETTSIPVNINPTWTHTDPEIEPLMSETIVVTPEIQARAIEVLAQTKSELHRLRGHENRALRISSGERSWRRNGGPQLAAEIGRLEMDVKALELLAAGQNFGGFYGYVEPSTVRRLLGA